MSALFGGVTEWLMKRRSSLPGWVNRAMESVARDPDGMLGRIAGTLLKGKDPPATSVPDSPVRLYIAPTNYSGQAYLWARSAERADPEISARNMAIELPGGYGFAADSIVPIATVNASASWADAEWNSAKQFTHVLVEAERSMFGRRFDRDLRTEISELQQEGVSVAYICHGTDIRNPHAHAARTEWSPYPEDPRTENLQLDAERNFRLLDEIRLPTFVSTPDLVEDVPWATWCPVIVDTERFRTDSTPFTSSIPKVIHVSSSSVQKGSHLLDPALSSLRSRGMIDYELVTDASSANMPGIYANADIVLDQFRLGSYGVAACEAMSAGRLVIGHVLPSVREHIRAAHGMELPIAEATPVTLSAVLEGLLLDPRRATQLAAAGPAYVKRVHDGAASAQALLQGWIREAPSPRP